MNNWEIKLQRWLQQENLEPNLKKELIELNSDFSRNKEELEERFYKDLDFGTGGLRGVLGAGTNRLNIYTIRKATKGICDYLLKDLKISAPKIAIGYDSRNNSRLFAETAARVLVSNGIKTYMYDELYPVPALVFALRHYKCDMGIMITASHNPSKYNGYKVYKQNGYQVTDEAAAKILAAMEKIDIFEEENESSFKETTCSDLFTFMSKDTKDAYLDRVMEESLLWTSNSDEIKKAMGSLKVVYTPLNGSGNKPVREIMNKLGIGSVTVVPEQENPDGNFPTCPSPNPEKKEALLLGLELAEKTGADLLLATDPDCDRVGIAARRKRGGYQLLTGNEVGLLLFEYIVNMRKTAISKSMPEHPVVVRTIVTSSLADKIAEDSNIDVVVTLTGFKYIGEFINNLESKGRESDYIFGFEESYGYLSGTHVRDKDGVNASLLIFELAAYLKVQDKTFEEALDKLYARYGYCKNDLLDFYFDGISGMAKMESIMGEFRKNDIRELAGKKVVEFIDYKQGVRGLPKSNALKFTLEDGSGFAVRPSGTEPKLKIYTFARGNNMEEAEAVNKAMSSFFSEKINRNI